MRILPRLNLPSGYFESVGRRESRIHNTSIGAPIFSTFRCRRPDSQHSAIFLDQVGYFRLCSQVESRIPAPVFRKEIQEIPLRHKCDEFTVRRQMRKIGDRDLRVSDVATDLRRFLMRPLQEIRKQAELVHELEG
jgi:hypothetical protein